MSAILFIKGAYQVLTPHLEDIIVDISSLIKEFKIKTLGNSVSSEESFEELLSESWDI